MDWAIKRVVPERTGIVFQRALQRNDEKRAREWMNELDKALRI
jgi:hypothetical protein